MTYNKVKEYFDNLNERKDYPNMTATAQDFLDDLCDNICLMYKEGGKYMFMHRNFQEYFCAVYFSKQKDRYLKKIGSFFERSKGPIFANQTFEMLYDMIPEKVEEYILLPFLDELSQKCDKYWTYLETMYPCLFVSVKNGKASIEAQKPNSFTAAFISKHLNISWHREYLEDISARSGFVIYDEGNSTLMESNDQYETRYSIEIKKLHENPEMYAPMIDILKRYDFPVRVEYEKLKQYRKELHSRINCASEDLFDIS